MNQKSMRDLPLAEELRVAEAACRAGGQAAMQYYGTREATLKAGGSPVTIADHASNQLIVEMLSTAFPSDAILAEESRDSAARLDAGRVWIVDPLDGTKEFLAQNGEFAVMIGLAVAGEPVLGVIYLPTTDVLYSAVRGGGTWVARDGDATRLRRAPASPGAIRLVGSRSHRDPLLDRMQAALGIQDMIRSGSPGVKCGLIAEGKRDLYIHPTSLLREWDTCAPEVLIREAGGDVTDCLGNPLRYNKPDPVQHQGMVACTPGVIDWVLERIVPVFREESDYARAP